MEPDVWGFCVLLCFRYLLVQVEDVRGQEDEPQSNLAAQKALLPNLAGQEIKHQLTELFTPNKLKPRPPPESAAAEKKKKHGAPGCVDWAAGYMPRGRAEISDACRQAFTATCNLLLECTTFPVYLTEDEALALYTDIFSPTRQYPGNSTQHCEHLSVFRRVLVYTYAVYTLVIGVCSSE